MIGIPMGARVWIATGHTDMRKGMHGLALLVQEGLKRDPFAGDTPTTSGRMEKPIGGFHHYRKVSITY
jgi:transposase